MGSSKVGACILDFLTQCPDLVLDIHESVVLHNSLSSGWSASLQVASSQTNCQVRDEIIRRLSRAMGDEDTPAVAEGEICTASIH